MVSETETFKPNDSPYTSREMGPRTHQMLTLAWNTCHAVPSSRTERFPAKKRASCHGRYLTAFPANSARGSGRADPEKTPASSMPSSVTTGGGGGAAPAAGIARALRTVWKRNGSTVAELKVPLLAQLQRCECKSGSVMGTCLCRVLMPHPAQHPRNTNTSPESTRKKSFVQLHPSRPFRTSAGTWVPGTTC